VIGRLIGLLMIAFVAAGGGGCSRYVGEFCYRPRPAVAALNAPATGRASTSAVAPGLTGYAIVVGVRRADAVAHLPLSVEVRLRLDNASVRDARFDPRSMEMYSAQLAAFGPPRVVRREIELPPGQPVIIEAFFPFSENVSLDDLNMQALRLRWIVQVGSAAVPQEAQFRRAHRYYFDDPGWGLPRGYPSGFYTVGPTVGAP
jgi:hypothetical protein